MPKDVILEDPRIKDPLDKLYYVTAQGKRQKLTLRQKKFIKALPTVDYNITKAGTIAGFAQKKEKSVIHSVASESLTKPIVQRGISILLNESGLALTDLNKNLRTLTYSAERAIVVDKEVVNVPDNGVRLEATKVAYKLHGVLGVEAPINNINTLSINISKEDAQKIQLITDRLEAMSKSIGLDISEGEVIE